MNRVRWLCGWFVVTLAPLTVQAQQFLTETMLEPLGLHQAWTQQTTVDFGRGRVAAIVLQADGLFVQSQTAGLEALDPETGRELWSRQVGMAHLVSTPPTASRDYVAVTNGSQLFVLDRPRGGIIFQRTLASAPGVGASINNERVYVPMLSGALESYKLSSKQAIERAPVFFYGSGMAGAPPLLTETHLIWGTSVGNVYIDSLTSSSARIKFLTSGPVVGALAYLPPLVFAASEDHYVYAIHETTGKKIWSYYIGSPIRHQPVAIDGAVYVIPDSGGMRRLDAERGTLQWTASGVMQFVSASPSRVYAADKFGQLLILDAKTGSRLGVLPAEWLTFKMINTHNDRIYLSSASGRIQCLRERELVQPISHALVHKKAEKESTKKKAEAKEEAAPAEDAKPEGEMPAKEGKEKDPFAN